MSSTGVRSTTIWVKPSTTSLAGIGLPAGRAQWIWTASECLQIVAGCCFASSQVAGGLGDQVVASARALRRHAVGLAAIGCAARQPLPCLDVDPTVLAGGADQELKRAA